MRNRVLNCRGYIGGEKINAVITSPQIKEEAKITINTPKYNSKSVVGDKVDEDSMKKLLEDSEKTRQVTDLGLYFNIAFTLLIALIPVTLAGLAYKRTIESAADKTKETIQEKFTHIQYFQQEVNHQSSDIKTIVSEIKEISRQTENSVNELRTINKQNSPELFQRMSLIIDKIDQDQRRAYDLANYLNQQNNGLQQGINQLHRAVFDMQKDLESSMIEDKAKIIFANKELLQGINIKLEQLKKEIQEVDHTVSDRLSNLHPVDIPQIYDHVE